MIIFPTNNPLWNGRYLFIPMVDCEFGILYWGPSVLVAVQADLFEFHHIHSSKWKESNSFWVANEAFPLIELFSDSIALFISSERQY